MKLLITLSISICISMVGLGQNDVLFEGSNPRIVAQMDNAYGGFYFNKSAGIKGGLIYDNDDKVIRLGHTANPQNEFGFSLLAQGTYQGNFAMGMVPGQHYFSIFHNSIKIAGSVNHPSNSAHLALIEDDDDDFARIWFLNSGDNNRWALIGKSNPEDSKMGMAYNGVGKFTVDTLGHALFNKAFKLPNADGSAGEALITNGAGVVEWGAVSSSSIEVADADEDTKITVEETVDSDEINMYSNNSLMLNIKEDKMYIPSGVFSGYGTTEPLDPIHIVAENDDEYAGFYAEGGTGTKHVHYILDNRTANGKRYSLVSVGDDSSIPNGSFAIRDLDNTTERILIDPDGDVGIGTNNPDQKLHVNGGTKIDGELEVQDALTVGSGIGAQLIIGNDMITDGGADILRTDANFTPSVNASYNLGGSSFRWDNIWMDGNINLGTSKIYEDGTDIIKTDSHIVPEVSNSKNLGESTLRWEDIHMNGKHYIGSQYFTRGASNNVMLVSTNFGPTADNSSQLGGGTRRWTEIFAVNGVINTSDKRAKTDIQNLNYGLNEVLMLRPVDFNWKKNKGEKKTLGLIAQELLEIIPEVIVEPQSEEEFLGVKYADLVPVLIKAIQEQQDEIDVLKKDLSNYSELSNQMAELKANMESLRNGGQD